MFRMAVPMLYAAMGASLGTLAGVATAFMSVPMASAASVDNDSGIAQMAALVLPSAEARANSANSNDSAVEQPAVQEPAAHRAIKVEPVTAVEPARTKAPAIDKVAAPAAAPAPSETRPARHLAHPITRPLRTEMADSPDPAPTQIEMDTDQIASVDVIKSPTFYSEGDLTVADYNAEEGTIQTSDGRTFELGETVSMGNTVAWDQYRSNVHYRCEQDGSCVLQRDGVVTINSRQI
jgi:hypothetical protein